MHRSVPALGALLTVLGLAACGSDTTTTPSSAASTSAAAPAGGGAGAAGTVQISGFAFKPATLTITKGTSVTWTNMDSATHTATGSDFDSSNLATGASFSHTFATAGTFSYHCSIHSSMMATITVN